MTLDARSEISPSAGEAPERTSGAPMRPQWLVAAYEAALAVATEVTTKEVLQRIVDLARQVVPAKYAALGVADETGWLTQFLTSGITAEERAALGPIPQGHGLLGVLIRERQPLLVPNIGDDPRSVGFPPHHPPMKTLLGVPILLGDRVLGDLYLTERLNGEPFTEDDLAAVQVLAAHAATAIDRARLFQALDEARARAEAQRDQLRVLLDTLPSGVMIQAAPDGRIELANSNALHLLLGPGAPPGTFPVYGRDYRVLQPDGGPLPAEQRPGQRALAGTMVRNRRLLLERADGARIPVLEQSAPLREADGTISRAVVVVQDITRLHEAEQLKDDFLSLISHELRTPMTSIHGGAHLLVHQGAELDEVTHREILVDIVTESDRLDRMLGNMLSLTAILGGRLEPATEPVLLESLVRRVAREAGPRHPHHRFVVDVPSSLPPAEGDPNLLTQVLGNLYDNAAKYSPDGGEVVTTASHDAATVTLHVTDHGIGVRPDLVSSVFDRFRRVGDDPTVRGMGLGLYLSRHLVEAQGGTIAASSPGLGQGASFSVTLPIATGWHNAETDE